MRKRRSTTGCVRSSAPEHAPSRGSTRPGLSPRCVAVRGHCNAVVDLGGRVRICRRAAHAHEHGCHDVGVSDGRTRSTAEGKPRPAGGASIDELLDRAVAAINRGDRATATALAGQVLAADGANAEAEDLLAAPSDPGEIRRLTILFADLVDSTVLSTREEPETYRLLVGRYREQGLRAVNRYEGHIGSTQGDGLLAVFGHPIAHEDDVCRAVHAGLEITREPCNPKYRKVPEKHGHWSRN